MYCAVSMSNAMCVMKAAIHSSYWLVASMHRAKHQSAIACRGNALWCAPKFQLFFITLSATCLVMMLYIRYFWRVSSLLLCIILYFLKRKFWANYFTLEHDICVNIMESDPPTPSSEREVEEDPMPVTSFARRSLSLISIEPAIFLGTLGYGLSSIISQVIYYVTNSVHSRVIF